MSQVLLRTATAVTLAVIGTFSASVDARGDDQRVLIRIYDAATGDPAMRATAIRTAASILEDAGIAADWRDCARDGDYLPCDDPGIARTLIVRIVPTFVPPAGAQRRSPEMSARAGDADLELGYAVVDAASDASAMATIFHDRVRNVAFRFRVDHGELLGRAMAHEIGHLLLRAPGHGSSGLMRAEWTGAELASNRPDDWLFAPAERRRLKTGVVAADAFDLAHARTPSGRR